jgi:uncharacterized protein
MSMSRGKHWLGLLLSIIAGPLLFIVHAVVSPSTAFAFAVPPPEGAVTDTTGTLSVEDDAFLEQRISAYRLRTTNEIGVLIVPSTDGEPIKEVAFQTFNTWGVGKKDLNNGVLIVIASMDHRTRIEVGKGIDRRLTDAQAS